MYFPSRERFAFWTAVLGVFFLGFGIYYNVAHFLDPNGSFLLGSTIYVGYIFLLVTPIILQAWWLLYLLIGLTVIFVVWLFQH